jgi:hypothetical protein
MGDILWLGQITEHSDGYSNSRVLRDRWFEVLASYDFEIQHRAGRSHNLMLMHLVADHVSNKGVHTVQG